MILSRSQGRKLRPNHPVTDCMRGVEATWISQFCAEPCNAGTSSGVSSARMLTIRGEMDGFSAFYAGCYPRLVAEMTIVVGTRDDAEDIVQEAFSRALVRWGRISAYEEPQAWVRRVAINLATSRFRSLRRRIHLQERLRSGGAAEPPSPEWVDVQRILVQLPLRQRTALVLSTLVGMSTEEIASEMGVQPATVRSWLHRCRTFASAASTSTETVAAGGDE
jgi:RNA polymerase sigma-70 factor (ECF subfamily)